MENILKEVHKISYQTTLRFVLIPEREDQLIDPVDLGSQDLEDQIIDIGTSSAVGLFSRRLGKAVKVGIDEVTVLQASEDRERDIVDEVKVEFSSLGRLVIDINVTGRRKRDFGGDMSDMVILERDMVDSLSKCLAFAREFFNAKDPYRRYDRMLYNVALGGIGHKPLMAEAPKGSVSINMFGEDIVVAFERPQLVVREDLINPSKEIERTLTMFRRRMKA